MCKFKKKTFLIIILIMAVIVFLTGAGFGVVFLVANRKNVQIFIDESQTYQTFEGFGASSAWSFRVLGRDFSEEIQENVISLLYGEDGLNLEIFRYNLGGGSCEVENCGYPDDRKTESFFDASKYVDYSSFAQEENYDFSKDSSYVNTMLKSFEIGNIKKLVIFCNSPHYLLTQNGLTNGSHPNENNLKQDAYEAFADYVLICAKNIKKNLESNGHNGFEIYLSPVNEPQWKWGGDHEIQEGCHYDPVPLAKFYDTFYKKLKIFNRENNLNFILDIYESGNYNIKDKNAANDKYLEEFSKYEFFNEIEYLSIHSYGGNTSIEKRVNFQRYLEKCGINKKIAISEYCVMQGGIDYSVDMGLYSSKVLIRDLLYNNATEWSWWLGLAYGNYEDALVYLNKENKEISQTFRYYMYKNIMDYIDVGDIRIKTDFFNPFDWSGLETVAFKKTSGEIVIIVLNDSNKDRNLDYTNLRGYSTIKVVSTSENGKLIEHEKEFSNVFNVKAKSITTFVCS